MKGKNVMNHRGTRSRPTFILPHESRGRKEEGRFCRRECKAHK
jgi:hypothetical protein